MDTEKSAVDIVHQTHRQGKERIIVFKNMARVSSEKDIFLNFKDISNFFHKHIPIHFGYEEMLIDILKTISLNFEERAIIDEILNEHKKMMQEWHEITGLIKEVEKGNNDRKKELIELVNNLLESLIEHAKKEDKFLFPMAEEKLNEQQKKELNLKISEALI